MADNLEVCVDGRVNREVLGIDVAVSKIVRQ